MDSAVINGAMRLGGAGLIKGANLPSSQTYVDERARRVVDGSREREQVLSVAFAGSRDRGQAGAEGEFEYCRTFLRLCEGRQMSKSAWLASQLSMIPSSQENLLTTSSLRSAKQLRSGAPTPSVDGTLMPRVAYMRVAYWHLGTGHVSYEWKRPGRCA